MLPSVEKIASGTVHCLVPLLHPRVSIPRNLRDARWIAHGASGESLVSRVTASRRCLVLGMLFLAAACAPESSSPEPDTFEGRLLKAIVENDDRRDRPCVPLAVGRPVDRGVDDIRFETVPGAYRVVIANGSASSWRMVDGYSAMRLFTLAGFFRSTSLDIDGPDGTTVPAVAFELTRKGYEAMGAGDCFRFGKPNSVSVSSKEPAEAPPQVQALGESYRIHYKLEFERLPWADTPEFTYVYSKLFNRLESGSHNVGVFVVAGKEILSGPQVRAAIFRRAVPHEESTSLSTAQLTESEVRKYLEEGQGRAKLSPCLEMPLRGASVTQGIHNNTSDVVTVIFKKQASGRPDSKKEIALAFFEKLARTGVATLQSSEEELRYVLNPSLSAALPGRTRQCLPLGEAKIESLNTFYFAGRTGFRGWGTIDPVAPWTAALAGEFPGVATALREGFGVRGSIKIPAEAGNKGVKIDAHASLPQFGAKPQPPGNAFVGISAEGVRLSRARPRGLAAVDKPGYESRVAFVGMPPCVSVDGTTVNSTKHNSTCPVGHRVSRGYTGGKIYAEISFTSNRDDRRPDTWTNAAFTNKRFSSSLSTGAAHFSFAGSFTKQQLESGDLIGIAADLDEGVIYWQKNGEWQTGRPGSGIGVPILDLGTEYFLAASVQRRNDGKSESWTANFGDSPFKYSAPEGYSAYGAPLPQEQSR